MVSEELKQKMEELRLLRRAEIEAGKVKTARIKYEFGIFTKIRKLAGEYRKAGRDARLEMDAVSKIREILDEKN